MFILPASAHPFDLAPKSFPAAHAWHPWLSPLRLPLVLLATLLIFALVRAVLASRRPIPIPVAVVAKPEKAPVHADAAKKETEPESQAAAPGKRTAWSWLGFLKWETLPPISLAEALPITLHPPPPPAMRGRYVYRGGRGVGFVRRPEPALSTRPAVEAPLPAIYESQTPVSMAKLIMSRHTYRRPASPGPRRAPLIPPPSSSASSPATPPPAPRRTPSPPPL